MTMMTRGVVGYLLLVFGLAWSTIFVARLLLGLSLENSLVQIPIAFSPAIAAVTVRGWITKEGFADAGLAPRLRSGWAYYLVAWLFPLIAVGVVIGLATVLGISRPDLSQLGNLFPGVQLPGWAGLLLLMVVPILMMPLFWGEEFGWRGYLQIRLLSHSPLKAAIATGFYLGRLALSALFLGVLRVREPLHRADNLYRLRCPSVHHLGLAASAQQERMELEPSPCRNQHGSRHALCVPVGRRGEDRLGDQRSAPERLASGPLRLDHPQRRTQRGESSRSTILLDEA
jgi:membrane protease YdiL (CAAX protease family)